MHLPEDTRGIPLESITNPLLVSEEILDELLIFCQRLLENLHAQLKLPLRPYGLLPLIGFLVALEAQLAVVFGKILALDAELLKH